jgi:hypothetical protein
VLAAGNGQPPYDPNSFKKKTNMARAVIAFKGKYVISHISECTYMFSSM